MTQTKQLLSLDIGSVRIGVAVADTSVKIAIPYETIPMDENNFRRDVADLIQKTAAQVVVVGYPRNQSGEDTAQTTYARDKAAFLKDLDVEVAFQDESLTSVIAEQRLKQRGGSYEKSDIDKEAAAIILQDYMEQQL